MTKPPHIAFALPDIGEEEIQEVVDTLRSGWLTTGPRVAQFESDFAKYVQTPHALAVNSGTAGLHLALAALGLKPGDEVITTPLTFCATVNVILQCGARPVFADIGDDLNMDPAAIQGAITPATRAILPVHIGGLPCDMDAIWNLAERHRLHVVEDAAHAAGSQYRGVPIGGGRSDAVAFSFYATKNLTTGEGGMVTAGSAELDERMRILCLHGIDKHAWNRYSEAGSWFYEVVDCGFKYNMSDIQAALGIHQLRKLDRMNARRAEIAARYSDAFSQWEELEAPPNHAEAFHSWHLYCLRLNLGSLRIDRAEFIAELKDRGIGCSVHFIPIMLHPYYRDTLTWDQPCTRAAVEYHRMLSLPIYSRMTDHEVDRVIEAVQTVIDRNRRVAVPVTEACAAQIDV
ncbi:MAG TPA: DegT/DnrJ/EryC1/StrS family aminotransferase [Bryobacteraceae bacterium]|jgi:dTDP-4-amino-4,6-dideoxygalactose transaminase